ncbi:MAG: carboxypeptidase-like regulatory domain-containing protein, partial [Muribaculaceae bacterium]|nr:carboxypeptidase-like regulatory domain-containing protein [Muribaculaceae bacterium]
MQRRVIFMIACLFMAIGAVAQDVTVTGTVYDEYNDPFPGVVIQPKDRPGIGINTDIDGNFTIKVQKRDVLVVSCLGYNTQEFNVDQVTSPMRITMEPSSQMLDEAVVVGLGTQRKISVVGAVTSVDVDQLQTPATNLQNMLGGRVPGVISIQKSGEPGKNISDFWIRGIGTFGANSSALVLI